MRAVITAGGTIAEPFASAIGTPVKALAPFEARTLLDVVIAACRGAGIGDVAVIGGDAVRARLAHSDVRVIDAAEDGGENVLRALGAWPAERIVYLTSDLPFVRAPGLRDFIERSASYDVTMALANAHAYERRFPGAGEHGVTLGGERVANGSAFVIAPAAVAPLRDFATRAFAARKSLFALARLLEPMLIARYLARQLRIEHVERYAQRRLGLRVAALRDCDPGLCYDVDTLEEYEYACSLLG